MSMKKSLCGCEDPLARRYRGLQPLAQLLKQSKTLKQSCLAPLKASWPACHSPGFLSLQLSNKLTAATKSNKITFGLAGLCHPRV